MHKVQKIGQRLAVESESAYRSPDQRREEGLIFLHEDDNDTQAYVRRQGNDIIVAFRGTESIRDMCVDTKISRVQLDFFPSGAYVHRGFSLQYRSLRDKVLEQVGALSQEEEQGKPSRLVFTGHSLGGALATIAALDAGLQDLADEVVCVTYGSPRVGNSAFAKLFNRIVDISYRFVQGSDVVAHSPTRWRFTHVRGGIHCRSGGRYALTVPTPWIPRVSDHGIDVYIQFFAVWLEQLGA